MKNDELQKVKGLSEMLLDRQIGLLRKAAQEKAQSEAALAQLAQPAQASHDLMGASAALAGLAYQRWADARRTEINLILARQTHVWMEAREGARIAFGKAEALRLLSEKRRGTRKG